MPAGAATAAAITTIITLLSFCLLLGKRTVETISVPTATISAITAKACVLLTTGSGQASTTAATQAAPAVIGMPTK